MLRIITHIERLLLTHDCVILPKFGGFVLQTLPATYQEEEHLFRPMRKEVMFNVTLQHTDGLLSESYMQTYGVDYRKAQLMLEEDIEALNVSLEQDKRITLGRIGTFSIGEEGQTIFTPGDSWGIQCGFVWFTIVSFSGFAIIGGGAGRGCFTCG